MSNPTCPYCGAEMQMNDWMSGPMGDNFPRVFVYFCPKCRSEAPPADSLEAAYAAAMRRYQVPPRTLTADDFAAMEGEPVFIQQGDGDEYWAIVQDSTVYGDGLYEYMQDVTTSFPDPSSHYGLHVLGWRALSRRPTDEERAAAKWGEMDG